jgi:plastocyanin
MPLPSRLCPRPAALAVAAALALVLFPTTQALAGVPHHHSSSTHRTPARVTAPPTRRHPKKHAHRQATTPATTPATTTTSTTPAPAPGTIATTPTSPTTTGGTGAARHRKHGQAGGLVLTVSRHGTVIKSFAHIASAIGASIIDFAFSPATITIHAGDTVTWTNTGKQPHTATADNNSWDTGILRPGQSGSHTFSTPGTYSYYCIVHPFMKGTVVVLAAATTTTTTTTHTNTTGTTSTTPTSTDTTNNGATLPLTGIDVGGVVACGLGLTGLGLAVRRRVNRTSA